MAAVLKGTFLAVVVARGGKKEAFAYLIKRRLSPLRVQADKNYFEWKHNGGGAYVNPDTSLKKRRQIR